MSDSNDVKMGAAAGKPAVATASAAAASAAAPAASASASKPKSLKPSKRIIPRAAPPLRTPQPTQKPATADDVKKLTVELDELSAAMNKLTVIKPTGSYDVDTKEGDVHNSSQPAPPPKKVSAAERKARAAWAEKERDEAIRSAKSFADGKDGSAKKSPSPAELETEIKAETAKLMTNKKSSLKNSADMTPEECKRYLEDLRTTAATARQLVLKRYGITPEKKDPKSNALTREKLDEEISVQADALMKANKTIDQKDTKEMSPEEYTEYLIQLDKATRVAEKMVYKQHGLKAAKTTNRSQMTEEESKRAINIHKAMDLAVTTVKAVFNNEKVKRHYTGFGILTYDLTKAGVQNEVGSLRWYEVMKSQAVVSEDMSLLIEPSHTMDQIGEDIHAVCKKLVYWGRRQQKEHPNTTAIHIGFGCGLDQRSGRVELKAIAMLFTHGTVPRKVSTPADIAAMLTKVPNAIPFDEKTTDYSTVLLANGKQGIMQANIIRMILEDAPAGYDKWTAEQKTQNEKWKRLVHWALANAQNVLYNTYPKFATLYIPMNSSTKSTTENVLMAYTLRNSSKSEFDITNEEEFKRRFLTNLHGKVEAAVKELTSSGQIPKCIIVTCAVDSGSDMNHAAFQIGYYGTRTGWDADEPMPPELADGKAVGTGGGSAGALDVKMGGVDTKSTELPVTTTTVAAASTSAATGAAAAVSYSLSATSFGTAAEKPKSAMEVE